MDKKIPAAMTQSSAVSSLSGGMMNSQSDWLRSNSFSSSSNDTSYSAIFCTSNHQRSSFPAGKRLISDDHSPKLLKRSRNSSGSSASSNMSSISDKDTKNMPVLISSDPISSPSATSMENLGSLSPTSFALQREALLGNRLSKSMNIEGVVPFRHNLRRNIRKKKCSCDCTTTCTTVVVSRQYTGLDNTLEEKTVISRTKVKTYVQRNAAATVNKAPKELPGATPKDNPSSKSESFRKRRSEIEQLYDSLHEIKWAKNFSPDNILRQFDVRQAASCSAFGRSHEDKSPLTESPKKRKFTCSHDKVTLGSSLSNRKLNKTIFNCHNKYATRSKGHFSQMHAYANDIGESQSPLLEKSNAMNGDLVTANSNHFEMYPHLPKEAFVSPKCRQNSSFHKNSFDCSTDFSSLQADSAPCNNLDIVPKKYLNFDLKSQEDNGITEYTPTFFDYAEEGIRTIDACFREVGAEVVVSTCYETDYNLPRLTSVEDELPDEEALIPIGGPPVLEPLPLKQTDPKTDEVQKNVNVDFSANSPDSRIACLPSEPRTFFPHIDTKLISEEDYFPPPSCFDEVGNPVASFHEIKAEDDAKGLPCLASMNENRSPTLVFEGHRSPPVLEPCFSSSERCGFSVKSKIKNRKALNGTSGSAIKEVANEGCTSIGDERLTSEIKNIRRNQNETNNQALAKSIIIKAGKRIFNRYLKFLHSKAKKQGLTSGVLTKVEDRHCNTVSYSLSNEENELSFETNCPSLVVSSEIMLTHEIHHQTLESITNTDSLSRESPLEAVRNGEDSLSSLESCPQTSEATSSSSEKHRQTSDSVSRTADDTAVIQTFNQNLSYCQSPEKVIVNHSRNESIFIRSNKKSDNLTVKTRRIKSSFITNSFSHNIEHLDDTSGYTKILNEAKKKDNLSLEKVKVPSRLFTCHYQTINVTHGSNYIQIILKVNRGKSIYLTHESLVELKEAIQKADADSNCRLLILNGFGQTFCLGLDLRPLVSPRKNQAVGEIATAIKDLISTLADFHKPLVAIVNGAAYGLGLTLLNHADVTLATDNASFCMPYSRLGYMPEGGATLTLPQAIGTTVAMDMILRGEVITARQAKDIGLVNEVVEVKQLPKDLVSRVQTMAENSISGMETTKAMIKMRLHVQLPSVLETESRLLPQMWLSPTCQAAIHRALESGFFADC